MDANKLGCRANQAVIKGLDERITALEGGYTAGTGIDITDDVISIDSDTIYTKTEVNNLIEGVPTGFVPVDAVDDWDTYLSDGKVTEVYTDEERFKKYNY